jgi:hypothetical protein
MRKQALNQTCNALFTEQRNSKMNTLFQITVSHNLAYLKLFSHGKRPNCPFSKKYGPTIGTTLGNAISTTLTAALSNATRYAKHLKLAWWLRRINGKYAIKFWWSTT